MADTQQPVDQPVEEQVTSKVPVTKQKNPKRVAAGKAIAEKTRIAREKQKKDLFEAQSIIALGKKLLILLQPRNLHRRLKTFLQQQNC